MSSDHSFLIAASCSGVNFLIAAFLMLAIGWLWNRRMGGAGWLFLLVSIAAAYVVTILANTVRISTAMQIRRIDPDLIWLNPDQMHRFEGIVVYFGFLLLLFVAVERMFSDPDRERNQARWRRWVLPLSAYYGTTLGVPLVNAIFKGGLTKAEFWEHAVFVLLIPLALLGLLAGLRFIRGLGPDLHIDQID
jgi:exosortase/archaeosortase family protein